MGDLISVLIDNREEFLAGFWVTVRLVVFSFVIAMVGTAAIIVWGNQPKLAPMLLLLPALFGIPMWHEAQLDRKQIGEPSQALAEHDLRTLMAVFAFIFCMGVAVAAGKALGPGSPFLWIVALLPILPILAVIWAMGRYLVEETDEYLKMRYVTHALFGLGLLLIVATVWGFLESFKVVPHVESWMAVPVWAIGLGVAQIWHRVRGS